MSKGLTRALIALHGQDSVLAAALGRDVKGKVSVVMLCVRYSSRLCELMVCRGVVRSGSSDMAYSRPAY